MSYSDPDLTIRVPKSFMEDFYFMCRTLQLPEEEVEMLRARVRANFDLFRQGIEKHAAMLRRIVARWGGIPTLQQIDETLQAIGAERTDDMKQLGLMTLADRVDRMATAAGH